MAIDANKVYHVMNGNATTRRMNLYSSGSVSNGMNVVLYDNDDSNEQKWYFDGERFFPESGIGSSYHKFCLDRYTASAYLNNADIWEATDADAAAQVVEVIKYGYYQRVRLKTKITNADGEEVYYYLTAGANANGTGSGKTAGAAGNIYWAEETTVASEMMRQNWIFTEVDGSSSSGDETGGNEYDKNYLIYPTKTMNITQNTTDGNHIYCSTETPRDYPIDEACENDGRSYFYCPCDEMVVKRVYTKGTNTLWLESTSPVVTPSGTYDKIVMMVMHPDDDDNLDSLLNKTFTRGETIFREGMDGYATGYHFHISVGTGSYTGGEWGNGWYGPKSDGRQYSLTPSGQVLRPEQAFYVDPDFTTIINSRGINFTTI